MLSRLLLALLGIGIAHADVVIFQGTQFDENQFVFSSARSGADPKITVGGNNSPANIGIDISGKGSGQIKLLSSVLFADGSVWSSSGFPNAALNSLFASPPAIGNTTPNSGSFTALAAAGAISGAGFTNYFASPPGIGGTAPAAGAFTTLAASGAVSGAGFSNYLASPPAIGGTTPAAITGTTVTSSGTNAVQAGNGAGNNEIKLTPSATGSDPTISVTGGDANRNLSFVVPGSGLFLFSAGIAPSQTGGVVGTTTNNNANAGSVGEYVVAALGVGSAIGLTTGTAANVTSVSLTAGDWACSGNVLFGGTFTSLTVMNGWINQTSATNPSGPNAGGFNGIAIGGGGTFISGSTVVLPPTRELLSGTTTVYLGAQATFSGGTGTAYGSIECWRKR